MSRPARTAFDLVNPGMPPAIELSHDLSRIPRVRRYVPHPLDPWEHDRDLDPRSDEQFFEDEQAYHGSDRR